MRSLPKYISHIVKLTVERKILRPWKKNQISFTKDKRKFIHSIDLFPFRSNPPFPRLIPSVPNYLMVQQTMLKDARSSSTPGEREANESRRPSQTEGSNVVVKATYWSRRSRSYGESANRFEGVHGRAHVKRPFPIPPRIRVIMPCGAQKATEGLSNALRSTANVARDRYRWMGRRASHRWLTFLREQSSFPPREKLGKEGGKKVARSIQTCRAK